MKKRVNLIGEQEQGGHKNPQEHDKSTIEVTAKSQNDQNISHRGEFRKDGNQSQPRNKLTGQQQGKITCIQNVQDHQEQFQEAQWQT